ncbi:DMT family transporter [Aliivibrio kagoshimensis]|uniref:DMT family transporter n=1 Tax=Aliivibrio kagoshimensis TaxID=2910230 RepID=UPI003D0A7735
MNNNQNPSSLYLFYTIIAATSLGAVATIAKYAQVTSETLTFYRIFFGLVFLALYLLKSKQTNLMFKKPTWLLLLNGVFIAGMMSTYVQAMEYMDMVTVIMMIYLAPVVASLVAHFCMNERLSSLQFTTIMCAFLGFSMVMEFQLSLSGAELQGFIYSFIALGCYTSFIIVNRLVDERIHDFTRSSYQLIVGSICMLPFAWQDMFDLSIAQFGWMVLAGLIPGFLGIVLSIVALRKVSAATFGTLAYMEPVTVIALGWLLFGQTLSFMQISGCLVIIMAGLLQAKLALGQQQQMVAANDAI